MVTLSLNNVRYQLRLSNILVSAPGHICQDDNHLHYSVYHVIYAVQHRYTSNIHISW